MGGAMGLRNDQIPSTKYQSRYRGRRRGGGPHHSSRLVFGIWYFVIHKRNTLKPNERFGKGKTRSEAGALSGRGLVLFAADDGLALVTDHRARNLHRRDIFRARDIIHEVEHE